jgi:cytochrome c biogenesis protein CcdA
MLDRTLLTGLSVLLIVTALLWWLRQRRVSKILSEQIPGSAQRRILLAAISFTLTFAVARLLAYAHHELRGPFRDIYIYGHHIHHLVWGILLLLAVGYGWLLGLGSDDSGSPTAVRLMALLYGSGAALTLDEFALWLNLEDVYWAKEGRESIDATILFGAILFIGAWGHKFFEALAKQLRFWRKQTAPREAP